MIFNFKLYFVLECTCNMTGSIDNVCDVGNGKCTCKNNVAGDYCDKCIEGYHGYPECEPGK